LKTNESNKPFQLFSEKGGGISPAQPEIPLLAQPASLTNP